MWNQAVKFHIPCDSSQLLVLVAIAQKCIVFKNKYSYYVFRKAVHTQNMKDKEYKNYEGS